jgi:hypothetical protein
MDEYLIHEQKLVYEEILQQRLQVKPHIIIYKKPHQPLLFVDRISIEKILP